MTDDRSEMQANRAAGKARHQAQRLERATYTAAEVKALTKAAGDFGYELGRKEALADLRVVTSGMSYFALAYGPLYHTRESAAEALMKLRRPS